MDTALTLLGALFSLGGAFFLFVAGLGLVRMPDIYNRIQAGTKATTLGTLLSLAGIACLRPEWGLKLLLIALFILFTNPISSQVLARAAHRRGVPMVAGSRVDHLAEDKGA